MDMDNDGVSQIQKELGRQKLMLIEHEAILKSIRRNMRISTVFSFLRLVVIAIPIAIGLIYLPKLVNEAKTSIEGLQGGLGAAGIPKGLDFGNLQDLLSR